MPTVQSTYLDNIPTAYAGAIADEQAELNLISRTVETVAGVGFGVAVDQGTDDYGVVLGTGAAVPLGITVRDQSVDPSAPNSFSQYDSARIMTKGTIWVANSGGVSAGDPVHALASGELANTGGTAIPGARWDTTATDGNLAIVRLG